MTGLPRLMLSKHDHRALRALGALAVVVLTGTVGFMIVEGWGFWRSLFFTLITITTVGYGDYGLDAAGERFAAMLIIGGIGVATYSFSQFIQSVVEYRSSRRQRMHDRIMKLQDHFIICGLGRLGHDVCDILARDGVVFAAIDHKEAAVERAVDMGYLAVQGDATQDAVLERLGIARARGIACLTGSDAENIVITLSAREMNPDLVIISRAEHEHSIRKIQRAGATRVISPVLTGSRRIASAIANPNLTDLLDSSLLAPGGIELAEIGVRAGSVLDGLTVSALAATRPSLVLVAAKRPDGEMTLRPPADGRLAAGDVLIVAGDGVTIRNVRDDAGARRAVA